MAKSNDHKVKIYNSKNNVFKQPKKLIKNAIVTVLLAATITSLAGCNMEMWDSTYGFENAVITNDGNTVVVPVQKWKDYKGEAVQLIANDGMAILTSSYFTSLISEKNSNTLVENYAKSITEEDGTLSYYNEKNKEDDTFNYQVFDFEYSFDKAIIIHNNKAVLVPVKKWCDYDGEQIQIMTPDDVILLTSNYKTILINDSRSERKAKDLAKMIVGKNGSVVDLTNNYKNTNYNKEIWDFKQSFNKSIMLGDESLCILPIHKWNDYDGEQFQIKVDNGPTYVCSSFTSILVNDTKGSSINANEIANALSDNVTDYAQNAKGGSYNKQWIDLDYNFESAVITTGDNSAILPVKNWNDYDGEQLQFVFNNGVTMLSSAIDTGMSSHSDGSVSVDKISSGMVSKGNSKNIDPNYKNSNYNKTMWDTKYAFPYALVVNDDSILILSLDNWKDCADGERLQLTLSDKTTVFLTTAYDTKLVNLEKSGLSIQQVAAWFNKDGKKNIIDLSTGSNNKGKYNKRLSTNLKYNYAIALNDDVATIIPIEKWKKYSGDQNSDGDYTDYTEQLQITVQGGDKIYSDNTNIKLVNASDIKIVEKIAEGHLSSKGIINKFNDNNFVKIK